MSDSRGREFVGLTHSLVRTIIHRSFVPPPPQSSLSVKVKYIYLIYLYVTCNTIICYIISSSEIAYERLSNLEKGVTIWRGRPLFGEEGGSLLFKTGNNNLTVFFLERSRRLHPPAAGV
jgi:hypothetical protein